MRFELKTLLALVTPLLVLVIAAYSDVRSVGEGEGGYNEDREYFGELANI